MNLVKFVGHNLSAESDYAISLVKNQNQSRRILSTGI
jgi:hypothetical protein